MATSVPEVIQGAMPTALTTAVPITTALVPSDLVVCISSWPANSQGAITPSGLGTWSGDINGYSNGTNDYGYRIHTLTGVTGAGNVTLTVPTTTYQTQYVILVIRGMGSTILDGRKWAFNSGSAPTQSLLARDGAIAIDVSHMASGTPGMPASGSPSTGWVVDRNTVGQMGLSVSHNIISGDQTVTVTNSGNLYALGTTNGLYVFGGPLEDRVNAEYVETIYSGTGTQPPRSLRTEYVEALRNDSGAPSRTVQNVSSDVIRTESATPRKITSEYVEAVQQVPADAVSTSKIAGENMDVLSQALPTPLIRGEYVNVISSIIPPAATATVYGDRVDVLISARRVTVTGEYAEVLHRVGNASSGTFIGWGIPFTG